MIVYLAGPITAIGREAAMKREVVLRTALAKEGITTFAPACAWMVPEECLRPRVQHVDDAAISICDIVIVTYLDGVESVGTSHEVELALSLGKPILVYAPEWTDEGGWRARQWHRRWLGWRGRLGLPEDVPWVMSVQGVTQLRRLFPPQEGEWSS